MKIVKYAKYIHRWTAPRTHSFREPKNESIKSLVERLCDFKIFALSVLGYIGSISAPDEATLKEEAHASQCTTAGPHNAIPADLLRVGSMCGLGLDIHGIHTISLAARYRTASNSGTLANGLAKIQAATSRFRIAQILPQMCHESRASRPRLAVVSYASSAVDCVQHKDFTLREKNKDVELDAPMNPILSCTPTNALSCTTFSPWSGDKLLFYHGEASFPQLDHPDFSTTPSIWNCSYGWHRCLRLHQ